MHVLSYNLLLNNQIATHNHHILHYYRIVTMTLTVLSPEFVSTSRIDHHRYYVNVMAFAPQTLFAATSIPDSELITITLRHKRAKLNYKPIYFIQSAIQIRLNATFANMSIQLWLMEHNTL